MNLDFSKLDGLVTAVIQDHVTGRVLMVGFMNEEAFAKTVETGFATFYSRSRKKLWLKGEILRPPAGREGNLDRLRSRCRAAESGSASALAFAMRAIESCFFRRLENGEWKSREDANLRSGGGVQSNETQTRHSERQSRKRDGRSVPPRRLQHHDQQPVLFSRRSTIRRSSAC